MRILSLLILMLLAVDLHAEQPDPLHCIWHTQPAKAFTQSMVLGNGRIGAMVYGDPDQEQIVLNDESLWAGSPADPDIPSGHKHLPEIRRLLAEEDFAQASRLVKQAFRVKYPPAHGKKLSPFGRYQTMGKLRLDFSGDDALVSAYHRELDLQTGMGIVAYARGGRTYRREHFVSAPDQVFVTRLSGHASFSVAMDRPERSETKVVGENELLMTGRVDDGLGGDGLLYAARVRVIAPQGAVKADGDRLRVNASDEVLILVAVGTDYQRIAGRMTPDPLAATKEDLDKAAGKTFEQLRAAQKVDHEQFYNRVALKLPHGKHSKSPTDVRLARYAQGQEDPALEALFFNFGRYLLISSSRPGGLPANLQGIWAEEITTMWNGDYHFNINIQMNYWLAMPCNLVELNEPLINYIASLVEPGKKTAKAYYNSRGWIAHRTSNIWGYTAPKGMDIGGPAWLCEHLWEQYAFTLDKAYLEKVYPIMKSSVEFYIDNLYEEPENNWLVTGPSASPETGFYNPSGRGQTGICAGPTIDMQQLRELFGNTIKAAKILGIDHDLQEQLATMRPRLAPNQIDHEGRIQEWLKPYKRVDPEHRHLSPLYGLYPYYEITPEQTPKMAEAARALLEERGVGEVTGWSNAWKINLWARLKQPKKVREFIRIMLTDNTFDNLFSEMRPARTQNGRKNLFQIDANFGYTAGVAEALLQSHPAGGDLEAKPVLRLLPALPPHWKEGSVSGLRARGGFLVDLKWMDGKLVSCRVTSEAGGQVTVSYQGKDQTLSLAKGETASLVF